MTKGSVIFYTVKEYPDIGIFTSSLDEKYTWAFWFKNRIHQRCQTKNVRQIAPSCLGEWK